MKNVFFRIFGSRPEEPAPSPPTCAQRVYAVGDVHGRLDLLNILIELIDKDHESRGGGECLIIFLGDFVDRGPQSAQVIDRLLSLSRIRRDLRFIRGNHEEVMLDFLTGDASMLPMFMRIGGPETMASYGLNLAAYQRASNEEVQYAFRLAVPAEHVQFLEAMEALIVIDDYVFVHAGIVPHLPLSNQDLRRTRWIRNGFLDFPKPMEKFVVHGHTITDEVDIQMNRIGLDTGAYRTGRLTAMGFEGDARWVVQACDS